MTKPDDTRKLAKQNEAASSTPATDEVAGIDATQGAQRSGDDTRKRGWFWHWNAIVTQFAPLVGLKGVGLLNSYTVWTDRRAESPTRGYAFPSQQKEADFYGEERSELITINKILVTLDLIEIRKEMVLRTDEAGRRWRVPHNFYRVKDRDDGFSLTADAVYRVVELADSDRGVYRYVRHIFSPKFSPIDANNIWTEILSEIRDQPVWMRLAEKARKEEERNSARSRAGHRSRKAGSKKSETKGERTPETIGNDSDSVSIDTSAETSVAHSNKGSEPDVASTNKGSSGETPTSVDTSNEGGPTTVEQSNRMYNQDKTTTTTLSTDPKKLEDDVWEEPTHLVPSSVGPGNLPAPQDAAGEASAIRAFRDANEREPTRAETKLLRDLAERFEPAAGGLGIPEKSTGWSWVAAAVYEAVSSGSTFVAPRRVREIMARWERDGLPEAAAKKPASRKPASRKRNESQRRSAAAEPQAETATDDDAILHRDPANVVPFLIPEAGMSNEQLWGAILDDLSSTGSVRRANFEAWLRPTRLIGRSADGGFVIGAPNAHSVRRLETRFSADIEAAVISVIGKTLSIEFVNSRTWSADSSGVDESLLAAERDPGSELASGQ